MSNLKRRRAERKAAVSADADGTEFGGKQIRKRQAAIAVMAAANRNPVRFPDPNRFDFKRPDNRHLAFGYAAHLCFGAPSARAEGRIAFEVMLRRLKNIRLEPQSLVWRNNLGLRGLMSLRVAFGEEGASGWCRFRP
jgi:cytochrome P450